MTRAPHPYVQSRFEHQLEMVRSARDRVDTAPPPPGYALRVFRDADEPAYEELFHLGWPNEDTLPHTRQHALPGGFLVIEHAPTAQLVGSCVAFEPETPSHTGNGSLGWLLVDPAHVRLGLGKSSPPA